MLELGLFLTGAALFDSLATTQQILILIFLFSTQKPGRTALGFIVGIGGAYLVCGVLGLLFASQLDQLVKLFVPDLKAWSDKDFYLMQAVLGGALALAGPLWWQWQKKRGKPALENRLLLVFKRLNFAGALILGAVLTATSFPVALPYLASIGKISGSGLDLGLQLALLLWYNLVYLLPLLVPYGLFLLLRDRVLAKLHLHTQRMNSLVTVILLSGYGLFLLADALAWLWTGQALLPGRTLL